MAPSDRAPDGRFLKGWKGGPGRPRRAVESDYLRRLSEGVSLSAWARVVKKALEQAQAGDDKARSWLSKYLLGEPNEHALRNLAADEIAGIDRFEDHVQLTKELAALDLEVEENEEHD